MLAEDIVDFPIANLFDNSANKHRKSQKLLNGKDGKIEVKFK
jgi:hypothetical protein